MVKFSSLFTWLVALSVMAGSEGMAIPSDRIANKLSATERDLKFALCFNGEDLRGWTHSGNWSVEGGAIARTGKGGSLVYREHKIPDDFELRFEWKVLVGSNSGVYYRPGQVEYQILDNQNHSNGQNPRTCAASLYFCMAPSHDVTRPPGSWNTGRVVCKGTVIQHWLNGDKVVDFDYKDPRWLENVTLLRRRGGDLAARGGALSLQDHHDPVWFRSVRFRRIPEAEQLVSENLVPQAISDAIRAKEEGKLQFIRKRRQKENQ